MRKPMAVYEVYLDGELVARGSKEECAWRVGVTPKTLKEYASPSKSRPGARIRAVRLAADEAERKGPLMTKKPDPRISAEELREAMRRRHDMLLCLDCNAGWEI